MRWSQGWLTYHWGTPAQADTSPLLGGSVAYELFGFDRILVLPDPDGEPAHRGELRVGVAVPVRIWVPEALQLGSHNGTSTHCWNSNTHSSTTGRKATSSGESPSASRIVDGPLSRRLLGKANQRSTAVGMASTGAGD
jgi:hypothetical protein